MFIYAEGGNDQVIRGRVKDKETHTQATVIEFTSKRKRATVAFQNPNAAGTDDEIIVYCKGAPDMIIPLCTHVIDGDGSRVDINDETDIPAEALAANGDEPGSRASHKDILGKVILTFARQAYRTILTTYKTMSLEEYEELKA